MVGCRPLRVLLLAWRCGPSGLLRAIAVSGPAFAILAVTVVVRASVVRLDVNQYHYFAAYVVLQNVVLATAWRLAATPAT